MSLVDRIKGSPLHIPHEQCGAGRNGNEYSTGRSASQLPMDAKIAAEKARYGENANANNTEDVRAYPIQGNDQEAHQQQQWHEYPPCISTSPQNFNPNSNQDEDEQYIRQPQEHHYGFAHPGVRGGGGGVNTERGIDVRLVDSTMVGVGKVVIGGLPPDEDSRA